MKKFLKGFYYAWRGIWLVFSSERNMKVHLLATVLVVIFGFWLHISTVEWFICLLCIGAVLSAEMFNTAVEILTDKVSPEKSLMAEKVKDISAGAVLVVAIVSAIIGIAIFFPKMKIFF